MDREEEMDRELLNTLIRRRHELEIKLIKFGLQADPVIKIEIEDINKVIKGLEAKLSNGQKFIVLQVQPYEKGAFVLWSALLRNEFIEVSEFDWVANFTVMLPDAAMNMWKVCREIDNECNISITEQPKPIPFVRLIVKYHFTIQFLSKDFLVTAEIAQVRGSVLLNPLIYDMAKNFEVTFTVRSNERLADLIVSRFKGISPKIAVLREV